MLFIEIMHCYSKKLNIIKVVIATIAAMYIIEPSVSRTAQLCVLLAGIVSITSYIRGRKRSLKKNRERALTVLLFMLLTISSIVLTIIYSRHLSIIDNLDKLLSSRLSLQSYYWRQYGISVFGQNIVFPIHKVIDNVYMHLLINNGIIGLVILAYIFIGGRFKAIRDNDYAMMAFWLILMIFGLSEWTIAKASYSIFISYVLSSNRKEDKND